MQNHYQEKLFKICRYLRKVRKMTDALNNQLNKEIYSAYLYMSMSAYGSYSGLKGFANWFMVQYQEEMAHAKADLGIATKSGTDVAVESGIVVCKSETVVSTSNLRVI